MATHAISDRQWEQAQAVQASNWENKGVRSNALLWELVEHSEVVTHLHSFLRGRGNLTGLEVGIGPLGVGFLPVYVNSHFSRIVGVEPLPILAISVDDKALQKYAQDLQSRVEVVTCKGEELPFDDGSFDVACCINVVDHAQSPAAILAEIARVTRPGGLFIFGVNTLSLLGHQKWRVLRFMNLDDPHFVGHPHTFSWRCARKATHQNWSTLWQNKPSTWQRLAGHGRMSFWILRRKCQSRTD